MALYQLILNDRILGASASSSPGTGWTSVADFPTLVTNAQSQNLLLYLLPGTYPSLQIDVSSSTGSGNPLSISAAVGTATISLSGTAPYLFKANNLSNVSLSNLTFDGNDIALSDTSNTAGLVHFSGSGTLVFKIDNCTIRNATAAGLSCDSGAQGTIVGNVIENCDVGIFCLDSYVQVLTNHVESCSDNGILIHTSTITGNGSVVSGNSVKSISNSSGGTGQYGNGINVFRAYSVQVLQNTIYSCSFSAIRLNAAGNCQVVSNYCYNSREVGIYAEAPGAGLNLDGGIIANNVVDTAGFGISVPNSGLYDDGISRRVTVSGNQIFNITSNYVPEEDAYTGANGIYVEGSCNVVGNSIENAARAGIVLGTNDASRDLTASGNFIHSCPMGIGYSANPAAVGTLISSNLISDYYQSSDPSDPNYANSGAIVSVTFNGTDHVRDSSGGVANTDYGNAAQTVDGPLTVGMNKAH